MLDIDAPLLANDVPDNGLRTKADERLELVTPAGSTPAIRPTFMMSALVKRRRCCRLQTVEPPCLEGQQDSKGQVIICTKRIAQDDDPGKVLTARKDEHILSAIRSFRTFQNTQLMKFYLVTGLHTGSIVKERNALYAMLLFKKFYDEPILHIKEITETHAAIL